MARYQSNRAACGPAALHHALEALGIDRSEDELIKLTGQTPDGVGVKGMLKAVRAISTDDLPLFGDAVRYRQDAVAKLALWYNVSDQGRPVILCVDNLAHWVVCVGHLGGRYVVVDGADNRLVLYYTADALCERWEAGGVFYGIVI